MEGCFGLRRSFLVSNFSTTWTSHRGKRAVGLQPARLRACLGGGCDWIPENNEQIDREPSLDRRRVKMQVLKQILVKERADGGNKRRQEHQSHPFVTVKVNAFQSSGETEGVEGNKSHHHSEPMLRRRSFAKYQWRE